MKNILRMPKPPQSETAFTGRASPPRPVWQRCWVWNLNSQKETAELTAAQDAEIAAYGADTELSAMMSGAVSKSIFVPEMTVLVVKQEGNAIRCQVEEPGTGSFEAGQEVTVLLPDDFQDTLSGRLLVSFSPTDDAGIVTALDWTQLED